MTPTHRQHVEQLLRTATAEHANLMARLPAELRESLPVDAQGLTRAIDYLAQASGLSEDERRALVRPHAVNPAVLHARIFCGAPLARETVIGSFVEGARVRAASLGRLADRIGGETLGRDVRAILLDAAREAQLLVIGSRGRGGVRRMALGSVSQALLHHAQCPVCGAPRHQRCRNLAFPQHFAPTHPERSNGS